MSFGMARGLDFVSFAKLVKTMTMVVITGTERFEVEMPIEMYKVPIFRIEVKMPGKGTF